MQNLARSELKTITNDFLQSSIDLCQVKSDYYQGWSPIIPRMVTHQPKDSHPTEASMLQTRNLTLRIISQNYDLVTTARNGHLPSLEWSPTNPRMVTLHKEVYYRLGIWHLDLPHKTKTRPGDNCQDAHFNPSMVTNHKDVYYRLGIYD